MIILTENRKIEVKLSDYEVTDNYLIFKNEYGSVRMRIRREKIVAYGYGLSNPTDSIEILE